MIEFDWSHLAGGVGGSEGWPGFALSKFQNETYD